MNQRFFFKSKSKVNQNGVKNVRHRVLITNNTTSTTLLATIHHLFKIQKTTSKKFKISLFFGAEKISPQGTYLPAVV